MDNNLLSMLGLAKKAGMLTVGEEPVEAVVRAKDARVLFLAADAADNTTRRCLHFAEVGNCLWLRLPFTKDEIGGAVGRTSVALSAMTDIGFAAAYVRRLAQLDPRYAEAAERLEIKAERAARRKAEQRAHERNVRMGKVRPKEPKTPPAPPPAPAAAPKAPAAKHHRPKPGGHPPAEGRRQDRPAGRPGGQGRGKPSPYAHSRPVKKGKGSFRKKEG